ncbi:MAG: M20/M25/M40 family metallo-hydrolase [Christensenellales bacterium]
MQGKRFRAILLLIAVFAGIFLGYRQVLPPKSPADLDEEPIALSDAAEPPDFRLMLTHIREMAAEPHCVGSSGLERTQGYLKGRLEDMGYPYKEEKYLLSMEEVQRLLQVRARYHGQTDTSTPEEIRGRAGLGERDAMPLNNILVHVDAPDTDETVVFMAHTDSVLQGPGAFDDIVSVAALLEGLRAVQGKEIARDLLFLFTDGEEQGLLGAAKFVEDHPEYKARTRLVVNVEARGNAGAVVLFETTQHNLGFIETYRQAVPYPFSTSIATGIYKTMPNDTDLTHFIRAGYPGINLAAIEGAHVYHTELDNYETFCRDSALHYMHTAVGLVTHLALTQELHLEAAQDAVHFPFFPGKLLVMPERVANALAHIATGCTLLTLIFLLWKKRIKLSDVFKTFGAQVTILLLCGGITWALLEGMYLLHYRYGFFSDVLISERHYGIHSGILFLALLAAFAACAALLLRWVWRGTKRRPKAENPYAHLMGVLLLPALLGEVCAWGFPAASYLFSLPVLAGLLVIRARFLLRPIAPIVSAASIVLILLLYTPLVYLLHTALLIYMAYITLPVAMLPLTLILGKAECA